MLPTADPFFFPLLLPTTSAPLITARRLSVLSASTHTLQTRVPYIDKGMTGGGRALDTLESTSTSRFQDLAKTVTGRGRCGEKLEPELEQA